MEDLTLLPDDQEDDTSTRILACSRVMSNASPYFRVMLEADKFKEGTELREKGRLDIPLPETHAGALEILCDIFHLRTEAVPLRLELDMLSEIATLVDRYDCARAIQPWPKIWVPCDKYDVHVEGGSESILKAAKWTHVSCHLGYRSIFSSATLRLLDHIALTDLKVPSIEEAFGKFSETLQETILNARQTYINSLRQLAASLQINFEEGINCSHKAALPDHGVLMDCSAAILGTFMLAMRQESGANWEDEAQWIYSCARAGQKMSTVGARLKKLSLFKWFPDQSRSEYIHHASSLYQARTLYCSRGQEISNLITATTAHVALALDFELLGNPFYAKSGSQSKVISQT